MKKIDYKEIQVTQKTAVCEYLICDKCGRVIYKKLENNKVPYNKRVFVDWYTITTGHNDWGNDSDESIEYHDICPKCICDVFTEYVKRSHTECGGFNTEYLNVDHDSGSYDYTEVEVDT